MELEQTCLVNAMHSTRLKDQKARHELSTQSIAYAKMIRAFALAAIQHPEISAEIETLKRHKPMTLVQRGGFIAIRERINKEGLSRNDIRILVSQLRNKAVSRIFTQTQDRDRGGRSQ